MTTQKFPSTVQTIIKSDLCVSCGACSHICPNNNISILYNELLTKWNANVLNINACTSCNGKSNCVAVCPSAGVDYMRLCNSNENNLLGKIKNVYNGSSANNMRRHHSSSGGFIKDICQSLLNRGEIQGIVSITHGKDLEYYPEIITDVSKMPNSIYHNINFENAVNLLRDAVGEYLVIGLPCHITSLKLLANKKKMNFLTKKIKLTIALICGYTFDRCSAHAFAHYNKFDMKEISYREDGRYRKTRISNVRNSVIFPARNPKNIIEQINNMIFFDPFLAQTACLYCVDHIGYCADLVVGDAWQQRYIHDTIGTNLIISRTEIGEDALKKVEGFNFEVGYREEIIEAQGNNYALGALGEAMRTYSLDKYFVPIHKRTENQDDVITYRLNTKDTIKIRFIKKLLLRRHYQTARFLYAIIYLLDRIISAISRIVR